MAPPTRSSQGSPQGDSPAWPAISLAQAHARLTAPGAPFETEVREIRGIPTTVWKHAPPTLRDLFLQARARGERTLSSTRTSAFPMPASRAPRWRSRMH
ncbi:hypothetical protein OJJOAM_004870 [Cupriavidus sp. H18C1]